MAKQFVLTEDFVREWNRIRKKVDGMRGPGVRNTPTSISIFTTNSTTSRPQQQQKEYFRVKTKFTSGGADGDSSNPASYLYDVYALDGTTLIEEDVEMIGQRPNGETDPAPDDSYATATYDTDGALKLWIVLEKPTDEICS